MEGEHGAAVQPTVQRGERIMKLPLIAASIVAYIVLAVAWICYSELLQ
jgi:hypothetical protein